MQLTDFSGSALDTAPLRCPVLHQLALSRAALMQNRRDINWTPLGPQTRPWSLRSTPGASDPPLEPQIHPWSLRPTPGASDPPEASHATMEKTTLCRGTPWRPLPNTWHSVRLCKIRIAKIRIPIQDSNSTITHSTLSWNAKIMIPIQQAKILHYRAGA